uniref:WD_REPEATS_REGION domain-containing protein n=1 Tax=Mesocestoides corti TaxID=53468 RepID=A0A5K3FZL6_MESCO
MPPALECCEHPSLLRISANLASGVFDTFAFGPKRILSGAAMHHYRVVTCAILALAAMGTRSSLDHLRPEVAARDLCPDLVSSDPPETDNPDVCRSQRGLASPHYGTYTTDTNLAPPPAKLAENHLNFEDEEVVRRTATSLVAIIDLTLSEQMNTAEASFAASHPLTVPYAASPVRRAAIDLLGRGFTLWEPYLDTAQLLTSLLSLIAEGSPNQFSELHPEEVLSDDADLARSARQALWQLTYTRPHLVVLNLSLMLRRLGANAVSAMVSAAAAAAAAAPSATSTTNASSSSTSRTLRVVMSSPTLAAPIFSVTHSGLPHATPPTGSSSPVPNAPHPRAIRKNSTSHAANPPQQTNHGLLPLLGARTEVLRLYADICQRRPNNLLPILPEFVEVILACVDRTQLKERGLNTAFPLLQRFNSVDSHTRAQKVCVGGTNGMLIFFDFKAGRYCSTRGHQTPVTAICFSSDGRQLASYAIDENTLRTWQLSTAGLFGMGGQQVRPLSSYPVRPLQPPSSQRLDPTMVSLTWPEPANIEIHHKGAFLRSVPLST